MRQILVQRDDEITECRFTGNRVACKLGDRQRHQQQRGSKDRRDDAGGIDLQRQMAAVGLHHAILGRALGILDQHSSLGTLHEADEQDQSGDHHDQTDDRQGTDRAGAAAFHEVGDKSRHLGDNAGHDDQRDTVADTAAGDLFTQPHQEQRTAYKTDNRADAEQIAGFDHGLQTRLRGKAFQADGDEIALDGGQADRILVEFLAARLALFLDGGQGRRQRCGQLNHDRGGNIGHDAESDQAHPGQRTAGKCIENIEDTATGLIIEISQHDRIDARQRHEAEHTENDKRTQREPDAFAQLCGFAKFRQA